MVLPRFSVKPNVASWFAVMPAGMEIIIAMEKPKAIITNNALILRLEIFLTALVTIPKFVHLSKHPEKEDNQKERMGERGSGAFFICVCWQYCCDHVSVRYYHSPFWLSPCSAGKNY
jgi:hypothetical protein